MSCVSYFGEPVSFLLNPNLNDVGIAYRDPHFGPVIEFNPNIINRYSDTVTRWWFSHECAHHALNPILNSEINADCFGIKMLVRLGLINSRQQLNAFFFELSNLSGSPFTGHLPGPQRVLLINSCALGFN